MRSEVWRSCLAHPLSSVLTVFVVLAVCATSLASVGQSVATEQRLRSLVNDEELRTVFVSDLARTGGIPRDAVLRLSNLGGVDWVVGLGRAEDVQDTQLPSGVGTPVVLREVIAFGLPGSDGLESVDRGALATAGALRRLGKERAVGAVRTSEGAEIAIVGTIDLPADVPAFAELLSTRSSGSQGLVDVVIRASAASHIPRLARSVTLVIGADEEVELGVSTSEALASFRLAVEGEARRSGRATLLSTMAVGAALIAAVLLATVSVRRREFGRRRALGASRWAIGLLVIAEAGLVSAVGALLGSFAGTALIHRWTGSTAEIRFTISVAFLACLVGIGAALVPALIAGRQDPVRIVRVP